MSSDDSSRTRKNTLPLTSNSGRVELGDARPRRSTLETFNDEMAVLDRPLEGDVEYIDEPKPSRARAIGIGAVVVMLGAAGALFMSGRRVGPEVETAAAEPAPAALAAPALVAAQLPAAAAAPAAAAVPAETPAPAAGASEADDSAEDEASAADDSVPRAPTSKGGWAKLRGKAGQPAHARATSGKTTTYHRTTTTTRHVVAKRTVTRHR